jgi:Cu/Ag efflux protein CusF
MRRYNLLILKIGIVAVLLVFSAACGSPSGENSGNGLFNGAGRVVAVDKENSRVTIDHGEIKGLMPAMQMGFHVVNKSDLATVSAGDNVEFTVKMEDGIEQIVSIKKQTASK